METNIGVGHNPIVYEAGRNAIQYRTIPTMLREEFEILWKELKKKIYPFPKIEGKEIRSRKYKTMK